MTQTILNWIYPFTHWVYVAEAIVGSSPLLAPAMLALAVVVLVVARSLWLTLASLLCTMLARLGPSNPDPEAHPTAFLICIQLLLLISAVSWKRRLLKAREDVARLAAERNEVQKKLDDEIRWRRAAEDVEKSSGTAPVRDPTAGRLYT